MLELYEQYRVAPSQTSEVLDGSTGGGATQKGPTRSLPNDEDGSNNRNIRPGTSSPPPDQSCQNIKGDTEFNESKHEHYVDGSEGHNEEIQERREVLEPSKEKHQERILDYKGQSPQDAIKRIDKDTVKAILEKRRKARVGDVT
ncbi:hypothetical protein R6Q59_004308 [Mikania micrantha]